MIFLADDISTLSGGSTDSDEMKMNRVCCMITPMHKVGNVISNFCLLILFCLYSKCKKTTIALSWDDTAAALKE